MKNLLSLAALSLCVSFSANAAGDATKGAAIYKDTECATCHSKNGMGEAKVVKGVPVLGVSEGPRIAGLDAAYAAAQITAVQSGARKTEFTVTMKKTIKDLSKQDIEDVSAYVAKGLNPSAGAYKSTLTK